MQDVAINYWAVLVCGVASMVIGSLWFGPLFGKIWQNLMGWQSMDETKKAEMMKGIQKSYILALVGALLMAFVLAHSIFYAQEYLKVSNSSAAIYGALWNWLGFMVPVLLATVLWEGKSWKLLALNAGYYLVQLLVFAFILVSWR